MTRLWTLALGLTLSITASSQADLFVLSSGGRIEGQLLNPKEEPRKSYLIKTDSGGVIELSDTQVLRVEVKSADELRYEELLPRMPATADGNWLMAEWCGRHKLSEHRQFHLQRVILLDPDHETARHALGYSKVGGRWVIVDEFMRSQGYVRYRGSWRTPQEVSLDKAERNLELAEKAWWRKLKMWRGWIGKKRSQEALTLIRGIDDPLAAAALADMLEDEKRLEMRRLLIEILGPLPNSIADDTLSDIALEDDILSTRNAALDQLRKRESALAVNKFIKALRSKENQKINRAGIGLAQMNDPKAIKPLIEAVTTKHRRTVRAGGGSPGGIGAGFGNDGASGLTTGSNAKVIHVVYRNKGVLDALVALTGENYYYDKEGWLSWHTTENTPKEVSLRRRDD